MEAADGRREEVGMRYILLIHGSEQEWNELSEAERAAQYERYGKLNREMEEHGHAVAGDELAPAATGKLVRVRDGETSVTDGPFAETKEQLGGYFVLDCDLDTALSYAAKIPAAAGGTIEVRPIVEGPSA
ncbi:MAG TPA: YciI family protein [Actinomycetota bacterium]|nr:YciI family protein [Actinomycetota bacterium]